MRLSLPGGAIGELNGKAKLLWDNHCDRLGNCLPHRPTGAITFEEGEAAAYYEAAVKARMEAAGNKSPGTRTRAGHHEPHPCATEQPAGAVAGSDTAGSDHRPLF